MQGDLIEVFKWVKGNNKGEVDKVVTTGQQGITRISRSKLQNI